MHVRTYETVLLVHKLFIRKAKDKRKRVENEKTHYHLVQRFAVRFDFSVRN
jgi:hypothetical protein